MPWKIAILFLLGYEAYALETGHQTLSNMMFMWNEQWSYFPFLCGFLTGGLSVHFFWRWNPKNPNKKEAY